MTQAAAAGPDLKTGETLARLARRIEDRLGLVHSKKREKNILKAAEDMASKESRPLMDVLCDLAELPAGVSFPEKFVSALTVGETYFFRERKFLKAFSKTALSEIVRRKEDGELRIWSAGCSTGEEAYTLAMILMDSRMFPGKKRISIIGTDINTAALEKARRGVYSPWSFRGMSDMEIASFFYRGSGDLFSVKEPYRRIVRFHSLNLAGEKWSLWPDGGPPDAIFCRNVLIYFSEAKRREVVRRFYDLLPEKGWLVLAPCETASYSYEGFLPISLDGATIYRKSEQGRSGAVKKTPPFCSLNSFFSGSDPTEDESFFPGKRAVLSPPHEEKPSSPSPGADRVRELADEGRLEEALEELEKAMEKDRANPSLFYLRSLILQELNNRAEAAAALRSALFLDPDFVMAHYALGIMYLGDGKTEGAGRHFRNAEEILGRLPGDHLLQEGEGHTAEAMLETVRRVRARS
ncbi:MAG: CheR family methyltransferase [Aminivibrio sp.]|jgi:chemotaxis protein methyltransferase CheR